MVIAQELKSWSVGLLDDFEKVKILKRCKCKRSELYGTESIFIVAEFKNNFIVYDDVEDEFGMAHGAKIKDGVLTEWELFSDLKGAFQKLIKQARIREINTVNRVLSSTGNTEIAKPGKNQGKISFFHAQHHGILVLCVFGRRCRSYERTTVHAETCSRFVFC
ncbi:MAG: hypothetical protein LBI35_06310 [Burkholderiales bacterium]|nr:hypothetical protein [Burkholderiales bacterium]